MKVKIKAEPHPVSDISVSLQQDRDPDIGGRIAGCKIIIQM